MQPTEYSSGSAPTAAKIARLQAIYDDFENAAASFKAQAACRRGCAFCCTHAGRIHITTLEGLSIRAAMTGLARAQLTALKKSLARDMKRRARGLSSACPFLMKNRACMIYATRPFVCRRIYSVETCRPGQPPVISRTVMELGDKTIRALQQLDDTGYTGHLSHILHMLDARGFFKTYISGAYKPEEVAVFGKAYKIMINRRVSLI